MEKDLILSSSMSVHPIDASAVGGNATFDRACGDQVDLARRNLLIGTAGAVAAMSLPVGVGAAESATAHAKHHGANTMNTVTTKDGTQIYYKDWGSGQPIVFSHGWPLTADAFEDQMFFLSSRGYRCIAHDRRGHGRSSQPWNGNDLDTYADDLATLVRALDLKDAIHVGHSTGGGEVVRYLGRHGTKRVAKAVTISGIAPVRLKSMKNPGGQPIEDFDGVRAAVQGDRSKFWKDLSLPFYGYNRPGAKISEGVRESFWLQCMMAGFPASYLSIKAQSETDFTEDLKKINVPLLLVHGEDDQLVALADSALLVEKLVKGSTLKVVPGAPHGICTTHKDQVNEILLDFIKA